MHDLAPTQATTLRQRWRQQLQRVHERMQEHCRAAMTATGGKVKPAVRILRERLDADVELPREMDLLEQLGVELGLRPPTPRRSSANPKTPMSEEEMP